MTLHNPPPERAVLAGALRAAVSPDMRGASGMDGAPKVSDGGLLNGQGANNRQRPVFVLSS